MDLSKLDQDEKLALSAAIVVFLAGLLSNWGGLLIFSILAALGVAVVVVLPQVSPGTSLPGSRGSLLAGFGFIALGAAAVELLRYFGDTVDTLGRFGTLLFIVALIGSAIMAWAGWQALQREGGNWQFGWTGRPPRRQPPRTPLPPVRNRRPTPPERQTPRSTRRSRPRRLTPRPRRGARPLAVAGGPPAPRHSTGIG